jgi:hypothetical protein
MRYAIRYHVHDLLIEWYWRMVDRRLLKKKVGR